MVLSVLRSAMAITAIAPIAVCSCRSPSPPPPAAAASDPLAARIAAAERTVVAFFGAPLAPYQLARVSTHRAMVEFAHHKWEVPELPCFAVAMGSGSTLLLLEPATWSREACDHAHDSDRDIDRVIAHELVHVFHGQHRPSDPEFAGADDAAWFVEGLATFASGQLDARREAQLRDLVAAGKAPTRLADAWSGPARYAVAGALVRAIERKFGRAMLARLLARSTTAEILSDLAISEPELLALGRAP